MKVSLKVCFRHRLSLTPDGFHGRAESDAPAFFEGGETLMLRPGVLDYWRDFDGAFGRECGGLVERHDPAPFGSLLVFDGRVPHAVARVSGTRDPRRGRLALTGWFAEPRLVADGGLADDGGGLADGASAALDAALGAAYDAFDDLGLARCVGFLAVRIAIDAAGGAPVAVDALCDTLKVDPAEQGPLDADEAPDDVTVRELLDAALRGAAFPAADAPTTVTLPLAFD